MMLSSQTVLVIGLLLTSAEAWAQSSNVMADEERKARQLFPANSGGSAGDLLAQNEAPRIDTVPRHRIRATPSRVRRHGDDHIREAQSRGPVDVLSLSMGGALACFFALAFVRRRKSARAKVSLPKAQVRSPGELHGEDHTGE
tara:strand:+ start:52645 stop:53073 length:429 start_codon:yes stop_codon:yes gene_type:complete